MSNKVYLTIGRHGHYGDDTPIAREDMLKSYITGLNLREILPACQTIYYSPLARARQTAQFQALGLQCQHLLETEFLSEDCDKFSIQKFINQLFTHTDNSIGYYHMVTHLPVVEKLGLPFLGAGEICLLTAADWEQMLAENFTIQTIRQPEVMPKLWQRLHLTLSQLEELSDAEIYQKLSAL